MPEVRREAVPATRKRKRLITPLPSLNNRHVDERMIETKEINTHTKSMTRLAIFNSPHVALNTLAMLLFWGGRPEGGQTHGSRSYSEST